MSRPTISAITSATVLVDGVQCGDVPAVAQDRDPVADLGQLVHAVRDVDDPGRRGDEAADEP
jgi:hypothetical protein